MSKGKKPKAPDKGTDEIARLLKEGLDLAGKDPEKYWRAQQAQHAKTKPWPGIKKKKAKVSSKDSDDSGIEKALFIGPRGGKWADEKHTIPWDPEKHGAGKATLAKKPKISPEKLREQIAAGREFLAQHEARLPALVQAIQGMAGESGEVVARAKELESAIGKALVRQPEKWGSDVRNLNDGSGVRIIHQSVDQVLATVKQLKKRFKVTYDDDRISKPMGTYRSYHLGLEDPDTGLQFEVQVRTANQDMFADWAHNIYKPLTPEQEKLKLHPEVLDYEQAMADYFWSLDNGQMPGPKPDCPPPVARAFGCL